MRTTLSIPDELLTAAKRRARERGQTLGELIGAALQRELSDAPRPLEVPPIPVFRGGTGPRPGIDLTSNQALFELLDEGAPLDQRR